MTKKPAQFLIPLGIVVKNRKFLMSFRIDSRPAYQAWELPGGGIEYGEDPEDCLLREIKEETGLTVRIKERLPKIFAYTETGKNGNYQVFLAIYICQAISGKLSSQDGEVGELKWFTYREALQQKLLPFNKKILTYAPHKPTVLNYID